MAEKKQNKKVTASPAQANKQKPSHYYADLDGIQIVELPHNFVRIGWNGPYPSFSMAKRHLVTFWRHRLGQVTVQLRRAVKLNLGDVER